MNRSGRKKIKLEKTDSDDHVATLVRHAVAGSRKAFEGLIDIFEEDIFRMVYYRTGSHMDAQDITQDILIQAYKSLTRLKDPNRFKPWLFKIALNRVRDYYRKKSTLEVFKMFFSMDQTRRYDCKVGSNPDPLDNLMAREFWENFGILLKKLSKMEQEIFLLRFMDSLTIKEISEILEKHESTVKTHLYRGVKKFKKESSILLLPEEER
jgi:RNA polymerase sigma-70 factor (ECF subfamily)